MTSPRAGQPADPEDLIDVAALAAAYYDLHPDPAIRIQRGRFGTSGHRGSRLATTFNEDHIVATSQAICEYRAAAGHRRPAVPRRRHPRAVRAGARSALEVFAANDVDRAHRLARRIHADAGGVPRDPGAQRAAPAPRPTASSSRRRTTRRGRRLQVQPAGRRPGRHRHHRLDPGPRQRAARRRHCQGCAGSRTRRRVAAETTGSYDFLDEYVGALPASSTSTRSARPACASAPTRSAAPASPTGARSASRYGLDLTVVNPPSTRRSGS